MAKEIQKTQTVETTMIQFLTRSTTSELTDNEKNIEVRKMISQMSVGLTLEKAVQSPKIFSIKKKFGEEILVKMLVVIVHTFCHSLKVKEKMDAVEVVDCARTLSEKYTHDSVKDIILALKEAKQNGMVFYNSVSEQVIYQIIDEFMNKKAAYLENKHNDMISKNDGSVRTVNQTIAREREIFEEKINRSSENKKLKELQEEKKDINKLKEVVNKMINKL
jgi:hypothetical protein